MNGKRFLLFLLIVLLAMSATSVFSQEPLPEAPDAEESTFGELLSGSTPYYGTWWRHTATTGTTYAVVGQNYSTEGRGVTGSARSATGASYGVWGLAYSTSGRGVVGEATTTTGYTYGVIGSSDSTTGRGVYGTAPETGLYGSGGRYGLRSYSSGTGALTSGGQIGLQAYSSSTTGYAVYARATATSGSIHAIDADARSTSGWAGYFTSAGNGIYSSASSTYGVSANASTVGVYGSANSYGVYGVASSYGLYGRASAANGYGVVAYGLGDDGTGVYASGGHFGVTAVSSGALGRSINARATAPAGPARAIHARTDSPGGWGGVFSSAGNGVYIVTPGGKIGLTVVGGTKNAAVAAEDGTRLFYTEESTEVWFTDYGFGTLEKGSAVVTIDPLFAQTVNLGEGYHVFLQAYGNQNLYVSERTPTHFVVQAVGGRGNANFDFSYRLVAKRAGYEDARLERIDSDTMQLQAELDSAAVLNQRAPALELQPFEFERPSDVEYVPEDAFPLSAEELGAESGLLVEPDGSPVD